ncbi:MAG TPA: fasciclin domain-containing protein [Candidatus Limnocylindrales bacterium]|nr:fasciclin domain-containing protein [Candidatus Limnocylindrales bacterium]
MRSILRGAAAATLALAIGAAPVFAANTGAKPGDATIVDIVVAPDGEFDILQAAVIEAGLAGALSNPDVQYTVFAPTDAAFVSTFRTLLGDGSLTESDVIAFIEAGGVDTALGDGALANILLYHVTNGRRTSTSVVHAPGYQMLNGERLTRGELLDAGIAATNISASNGVIHVINSVLIP